MMSLPFTIDTSYSEFADTEGLARLTPEGLLLEFQVKDAFFGLIKSAPKEALIPLADIVEASYKRGVFGGVITLRGRRLTTVSAVPGAAQGELKLKCRRKHRDLAQELATRLSMKALENDIRELAERSAPPADLLRAPPPGQSPG